MRRTRRWASRLLRALLLAIVLLPGAPPPAEAASLASPERIARIRARQRQLLEQGMKAKIARKAKRARELKQFGVSPSTVIGQRVRREPPREPEPARVRLMREAARQARSAAPSRTGSIVVNVRVNDPSVDPYPEAGQAEVCVAALGSNILVAWNDGPGFGTPAGSQGYGYSTDNGATWTDGGATPTNAAVGAWTSDPVVIVNEKTGAFYFCALSDPTPTTNAIGIVRGTFSGASFNWQTPVVARGPVSYSVEALDKQWAAVDSASGNVYISYTSFTAVGARIMFTRSTNAGVNWSAPDQLSDPFYDGYVQGSRVGVGPLPTVGTAPVYVAWYTVYIDTKEANPDYLHIRKSTNQGGGFSATQVAERIFSNWGNGAPGFNRGLGFTFPGLAVDRGTTATRGRVYVTWHESVNFYEDLLGTGGTTAEVEGNGDPASATPFTIGRELSGTIAGSTDLDYFRFDGTQGQTVTLWVDQVTGSLDGFFRLICSDGFTRLGFSQTGPGTDPLSQGLIVFTLPSTGTYYLRMAGASTGSYTIQTGNYTTQTDRASDTRDVFVKWSPNGVSWPAANTSQVNQNPVGFDDWLPEVGVAPNGTVYVAWYDWHDSPASECGGRSHHYIARSTSLTPLAFGGGSPVSDAMTAWTDVLSDIAPNQGDYNGLFVNGNGVYTAWSDGRDGNPNVYAATVDLNYTATRVALVAARATSERVELEWHAAAGEPAATVYRRVGDGAWTTLASIVADGSGRLAYVDTEVVAGGRYGYRLGLRDGEGETFAGEVWVDVPAAAALRLAIAGARPNPTRGPLRIAFTLPNDAPATLDLLDVSGRRVRSREVGGTAGSQVVDLDPGPALAAGVYVIRLSQGGHIASSRLTVVR